MGNFNSRPSARGDYHVLKNRECSTISIHAPPRGATHKFRTGYAVDYVISIHAPPRGATACLRLPCDCIIISIHAPPRGATLRLIQIHQRRLISIHAPPRGATPPNQRRFRAFYNFNSRPSARGDRGYARRITSAVISIHAPPRGATKSATRWGRFGIFQFTPLREGRHARTTQSLHH